MYYWKFAKNDNCKTSEIINLKKNPKMFYSMFLCF